MSEARILATVANFWASAETRARRGCGPRRPRSRVALRRSGRLAIEPKALAEKLAGGSKTGSVTLKRRGPPRMASELLLRAARMQLSRFTVTYQDVRPGEHVIYNVLEDRYAGLDSRALDALQRWSAGAEPVGDDEREAAQVMLDDGFLVDERATDDENVRAYLDKAAEGVPGTLFVTVMPTLQCNLACTYCFQKEHPSFTKMKGSTEAATLEWILRQIDEHGLRKLSLHYFGGEPLTRKDWCLRTAQVLSACMKARGGEFEWSMTTNAVLLDVPFAQAMLGFGPGSFKVTLDGDKETHDKMRVYRDGRGSFDQIFQNVADCAAAGVKITVGGNFFPDQIASFEALLDRLDQSGVGAKLLGVKFKPIVDSQKTANGTCTSCTEKQETQTLVQLNKSIEKKKFVLPQYQGDTLESMLGPCELHWKHSYTIDPDGYVYKCPAVAGLPELAVTQVESGQPERIAPLVELRPWEQCGDCPYLPVCVGGCLGGKYLKTGRRDEVFCRKEKFEESFRETVVRRYLAEFPTNADMAA